MVSGAQTAAEIIGTSAGMLVPILRGWQVVREKMGWDEYGSKLKPETRDALAEIFRELRRNGYANIRTYEDKILVDYIWTRGVTVTLCGQCERYCVRKDDRGVFMKANSGDEMKRCWQRG